MTRRIVFPLSLGAAAALWLFLLRPAFIMRGPASYIIVSGSSMEPTLQDADLAVMRKQQGYRAGDVIAFRVEGGVVIHRIVGGSAEEGFVTRGDNKTGRDPWRPRPEHILGRMWLHVPRAGRVLGFLRRPVNLSALVGSLSMLSLWPWEVKRRRRRDGRMVSETRSKGTGSLPAPVGVLVALGLVSVLALGLVAGAIWSFRQPAEKSEFVERLRYEHTGAFDYTVHTQPSVLYPSGRIGPIQPLPPSISAAAAVEAPPVYTRLARSLDLGFTYALKSSRPSDVTGELGAVLEIAAGEGWTKAQELLPPTSFTGSTASARVSVDFPQVLSLIETIEEETGFNAGTYSLSVVPTVRLKGQIGGETVDEFYVPAFSMKLNRTQITLDSELARSEVRRIGETVRQEQAVSFGGLWIWVRTVRWVSAVGAALSLAGAVALGTVAFLGLGRDEPAKIQARYGSLLISIAQPDLNQEAQRVQMASMQDLARLAQRDGRMIFHQELTSRSHRYFVQDGQVIYQYTTAEPSEEPTATPTPAPTEGPATTPTPTPTEEPATPTPTPTEEPATTPTPAPTEEPVATPTPTPTAGKPRRK